MMKNSCRRRGKDQVIGNNNKKKNYIFSPLIDSVLAFTAVTPWEWNKKKKKTIISLFSPLAGKERFSPEYENITIWRWFCAHPSLPTAVDIIHFVVVDRSPPPPPTFPLSIQSPSTKS